jgi:molybdate transport system regulatory protein
MKISARNQLSGTVTAVVMGAVNAEVQVALSGGDTVVASITNTSVATLGLSIGQSVIAVIKAPHISLVTDFGGYRLSARNQLSAVVTAVTVGQVSAEVTMALSGGQPLVASVTHDSVKALGLSKGQSLTAMFKAGAVMLAVPV